MYTVITYIDDYEHRPRQEVESFEAEEELKEHLDWIGPDQKFPIAVYTEVFDGAVKIDKFRKENK